MGQEVDAKSSLVADADQAWGFFTFCIGCVIVTVL